MATGNLGNMFVRIGADISDLEAKLSKSTTAIGKFGKTMGKMGSVMTRLVTIPMTGIATAAVIVGSKSDQLKNSFSALSQKLETVGQRFSSALAPQIETAIQAFDVFLEVVSDAIRVFASLPTWVKNTTVAFLALATVIGPLMKVVSGVAIVLERLLPYLILAGKYVLAFAATTGGLITIMVALAVAIPAVVAWFYKIGNSGGVASGALKEIKLSSEKAKEALDRLQKIATEKMFQEEDYKVSGDALKFLAAQIKSTEKAYEGFIESATEFKKIGLVKEMNEQEQAAKTNLIKIQNLTETYNQLKSSIESVAKAISGGLTNDALGSLSDQLAIAKSDFKGFTEAAAKAAHASNLGDFEKQITQARDAATKIREINVAISGLETAKKFEQLSVAVSEASGRLYQNANGYRDLYGVVQTTTELLAAYDAELKAIATSEYVNLELLRQKIAAYQQVKEASIQGQIVEAAWVGVGESIGTALGGVTDAFAQLIVYGKSFGATMKQIFRDMVSDIISQILKAIIKLLAFRVVLSLFPGMTLPGGGGGFGKLLGAALGVQGLAEGGIVYGPTLALVGEAGPEAVIPLNQLQGFGTQTINVDLDGRRIAESTVRNMPSVLRVQTGIMQ